MVALHPAMRLGHLFQRGDPLLAVLAFLNQKRAEFRLKKLKEMDNKVEFLCENEDFKKGYEAVRRTDDIRGRGRDKKKEG